MGVIPGLTDHGFSLQRHHRSLRTGLLDSSFRIELSALDLQGSLRCHLLRLLLGMVDCSCSLCHDLCMMLWVDTDFNIHLLIQLLLRLLVHLHLVELLVHLHLVELTVELLVRRRR